MGKAAEVAPYLNTTVSSTSSSRREGGAVRPPYAPSSSSSRLEWLGLQLELPVNVLAEIEAAVMEHFPDQTPDVKSWA